MAIIKGDKTQTRRIAKESELLVEKPDVGKGFSHTPTSIYTLYADDASGESKYRLKYQVGREYRVKAGTTLPQVYYRLNDDRDIELAHTHLMPHIDYDTMQQPTQLEFAKAWSDCDWRQYLIATQYLPLSYRITGLRKEPLQDISESDAIAEGVEFNPVTMMFKDYLEICSWMFATNSFSSQWDMLHAKKGHGWNSNPRVWVIDFEVVT